MGIPGNSLLHIIDKVRSWILFGSNRSLSSLKEFAIPDNSYKMHCECYSSGEFSLRYGCQSCGRLLCDKCIHGFETYVVESNIVIDGGKVADMIKLCKYCSNITMRKERVKIYCEKVHPSASPRESPEPTSPSFSGEGIKCTVNIESVQTGYHSQQLNSQHYGCSPQEVSYKTISCFSGHPSPVSVRPSPCRSSRSDEEYTENSGRHYFSPTSDYFLDGSDMDSSSVRNESCSYSVESSPSYSPAKFKSPSSRIRHAVQQGRVEIPLSPHDGPFSRPLIGNVRGIDDQDITDDCSDNLPTVQNGYDKLQRSLDFENNGLIWCPPPSEVENNEAEDDFFTYNDEEDNIGESGVTFSASSSFPSMFPSKLSDCNKEPLKAVVQGHFSALVAQLLQGEGIKSGRESGEDWLDIVTTIAWQAANFVRPDTSRGGSMDPSDYVKVKCIASGSPSESTFIKGVVCTKNIKHKRMTSQYKSPRLLLLGGALEYQRVPNQLASLDTLLHQENEHLKMIIQRIEALRPNVLLVERSVSSFAQEYLLAKDISLVLNVKKPLLERIAKSTGALITPSIDKISMSQLGHCELFRVEKVSEDHENANQFNRKPSKTLMYFEGCPRRLGCTVLLKGMCREELKKVKHVCQYAIFAAYHLSLETSFLADEGASLPKLTLKHSASFLEKSSADISTPAANNDLASSNSVVDVSTEDKFIVNLELEKMKPLSDGSLTFPSSAGTIDYGSTLSDPYSDNVPFDLGLNLCSLNEPKDSVALSSADFSSGNVSEFQEVHRHDSEQFGKIHDVAKSELDDETDLSSEYFPTADSHQSILVSFSSHCALKGTVCERSRLLRIKFYGCCDKPLGRYLRDDLFDQTSCCRYCKELAEGHVFCYTHRQGNLAIHVRRLPSIKLPGEQDGKIWMWHRCLRCAEIDGVPPATRRVVMSDSAWGLSFGKFLELGFSNHVTANRIANCGHSLQRDCLRFYGFGSMVSCFRYSPIDILSVQLPPSTLEFNGYFQLEWMRKEASELIRKVETLYAEILDIIDGMEQKIKSFGQEFSDVSEVQNHITNLKDTLRKERSDYNDMLLPVMGETSQPGLISVDILEINRLRRSLVIDCYFWDRQLYSLDSLLKSGSSLKADTAVAEVKEFGNTSYDEDGKLCLRSGGSTPKSSCEHKSVGSYTPSEEMQELKVSESSIITSCHFKQEEETHLCRGNCVKKAYLEERLPLRGSTLSERIDSAWLGSGQILMKSQDLDAVQADELNSNAVVKEMGQDDNLHRRRLMSPVRVYSFDSALRLQERIRKGSPLSKLHLSSARSFHASGDYRLMVRDPVSNIMTMNSEILTLEAQKLNLLLSSTPYFISSASLMADGVRLLLPQTGVNDVVIAVYDNEPSSIISYALSSKDYENWVSDKSIEDPGCPKSPGKHTDDVTASTFSAWPSFGSLDLEYIHYRSYGSEEISSSVGSLFNDPKKSPHLRISFGDDYSSCGGKAKFSVTCYFAKQFDSLRKKCCPGELDFVRSLSRCQRWNAQGGKSNVYFAKTLDERFIIKQVTKTELDSFEEFAPEYFKYLSDSLNSESPTCLAKILGIYQVTLKHLKGGKEMKMDVMVMENLFFKRSISKIYDLKGSLRSRYNPDTTGTNKVLLDMNLIETLQTKPIFLGSKPKRSLERAIWNDTSFLASVDVMDYSLLVGIDEKKKELVVGIIDFMRQYTWDKHLETWVKTTGILGGLKNASPTIISPKQYKKRFRKAMTSYFHTVPEQWSS